MNKKKRKKISALILLLAITIGYALLSTTLKINGIANIKNNTWDIHFENVVANTESTVTAETPSITDNATKVSYEVELSLPGDFYEFTVDAVNDGSINGIIEKIDHKVYESDGVTEATLPSYIKYSIVYDGTSTAPALGDILEAGESKTYRVRIEFDSEATTLPSTDLTYVIVDEVKYTQTKDTDSVDFNTLLASIKADPDSYRNPDQDSTNRDIGVDKNGNIVNLDWWIDKDQCAGEKTYTINTTTNEILLGGKDGNGGCRNTGDPYYTAATSAANIENGKWKLTIPQYIYDDTTSEFYPVTELGFIFTNVTNPTPNFLTEMPDLPDTLEIIGESTFMGNKFTTVTIPKNVKRIKSQAFANAFAYDGSNNTLTFESGSQLERIDDKMHGGVFDGDHLKGDLILPPSITYIGKGAFRLANDLTSVTFPSTATYYENQESYDDNSFDSNVTINHQY